MVTGVKVTGYRALNRILNPLGNRLIGLMLWADYDDLKCC